MRELTRRQAMMLAALAGAATTRAMMSDAGAQSVTGTGGEPPAQRPGGPPSATSRKRTMRSPRRIVLNDAAIAQNSLSTAPPPPNSLFWTMWNACLPIAQQALQTPFIQGIKSGTLDPVRYGGFNVNDAYYCLNGAEDYATAAGRADHPALRAFLSAKHDSYQKYNQTFSTIWHIQNASCVAPFEVCRRYSDFETDVATNEHPVYCLIVMLPCEYLWDWLAAQLAPPEPQNLYASWIEDNNDPKGAYAMGNFLDRYQAAHPKSLDSQKCLHLYTRAMNYELQNFEAASRD